MEHPLHPRKRVLDDEADRQKKRRFGRISRARPRKRSSKLDKVVTG